MKKYIYTFVMALLICLTATPFLYCENHFVRPGPNGGDYGNEDGSDWNNAYDGFPENLIRGDTYYLAGGEYDTSNYKFDDPEIGSTKIYIKKATISEVSKNTAGWQDSFATKKAVIFNSTDRTYQRALYFTKGYYEIDGVTGEDNRGHGIRITRDPDLIPAANGVLYLVYLPPGSRYITIKHAQLDGYTEEDYNLSSHTVLVTTFGGASNNNTLQYCYLKDFTNGIVISNDGSDNWLIEYCYIEGLWSGGVNHLHGETINLIHSDAHTIRYNKFIDATKGTGCIVVNGTLDAWSTYLPENGGDVDDVLIYGNIFYNSYEVPEGSVSIGTASSVCSIGMNDWKIYNNTFVECPVRFYMPQRTNCRELTEYEGTYPASGVESKNNLYYSGSGGSSEIGITYQNNYYNNMESRDIPSTIIDSVVSNEARLVLFPNYLSEDFDLGGSSDAINKGINLGKPFDIDMFGTRRPLEGSWDIGAIEFSGPIILDPPSDLKATDTTN